MAPPPKATRSVTKKQIDTLSVASGSGQRLTTKKQTTTKATSDDNVSMASSGSSSYQARIMIQQPSTSDVPKVDYRCLNCSVPTESGKRFCCLYCRRYIHDSCVPGASAYDDASAKRLKSAASSFRYICTSCLNSYENPIQAKAMAEKAQAVVNKLNSEKTDLIERVASLELVVQDLKRDKVRSRSNESGTTKRLRTGSDDFIGIASNPNVDNFSILVTTIEKFFSNLNARVDGIEKLIRSNSPAKQMNALTNNAMPNVTKKNAVKSPLTYAEALSLSTTPAEAIRNINIVGDEDSCQQTLAKLQKDTACAAIPITAIKMKGKYNLTIKCNSPDAAAEAETTLKSTYGPAIQIKGVAQQSPQIKIVRIFGDFPLKDDIKQQLIEQNSWLGESNFEIERVYSVSSGNTTYQNAILNVDLQLQKKFLERKHVIVGFTECRCFENINLMQCLRCFGYGHFARNCKSSIRCKKCGESHETKDCVSTSRQDKCANCLTPNKRGTSYNVKHRVTDDRCPCRIERIEALKTLFRSKN